MVSLNPIKMKVVFGIFIGYIILIITGIAAYNSGTSSLARQHCMNMGFDSGIASSEGIICYDRQLQSIAEE